MDEQQASDLEQANDLEINAPEAEAPDMTEPDVTELNVTEQNAGRRFFNRAERFVLQAAAGGRCEECGTALEGGFHADHRHPFIAGGPTQLSNARALCPDCNRRKAARLIQDAARLVAERATLTPLVIRPPLPDWSLPLRPWQQRGAAVWQRLRTQQAQQERLQQERTQASAPGNASETNTTGTNMSGVNTTGVNTNGVNMTVTATPGSGKTNLALFLAAQELREGRADLLVVVAPTRAIKDQWARSAHRAGLALTAGWGNNSVGLLSDLHGCIITYSQVASLPDALRLLCARHRVFCVLDEVHHAAESRAWGEALFQALEHAAARLCLSGTAWRQDGNMIPFLTYDEAGNSKSDVSYSYPDALRDGVVREAFFFALNARTVWLDETGERTATFADALGERDQSRRLRAALHAEGGWLEAAILQADAALSAARRGLPDTSGYLPTLVSGPPQPRQSGHPQPLQSGHPQAKGLLVAMNAAHARAVAARMLALTGEMPAVALSDDPASLSVLTRFRSGSGRWLVVVRMASEGYDCPDIRVVLWATNVTGEGAFRQIAARALRVVPGLFHQDAQVFLPADPRLLALARGLVHPLGRSLRAEEGEESESYGRESTGNAGLDWQEEGAGAGGEGAGLFVPLTSRAFGQRMVTNGAVVPASALVRARAMNAGPSGFSGLPDYALAAAIARMEAEAEELEGTGLDQSLMDHSFPDQSLPDQSGPASALPEADSFARTDLGETGGSDETSENEISENESTENESTENESTENESAENESAENESAESATSESMTYDQRRQELRRLCTRLTALVARELDVNPSVVHRAFHRSLGVRQADSTLAQLEQRKQRLEDKLRELRAGS